VTRTTDKDETSTGSRGGYEPRVVAFACNWCSYPAADAAGINKMQYPPNARIIRVMCAGRIHPAFVLKALELGADGVLVSGCHPGDCHYSTGNYHARRRFTVFRDLLDFVGFDLRRLQFSWISAAEGRKFTEIVNDVTDTVRALGPFREYEQLRDPAFETLQGQENDRTATTL